jgi:non-specific protein-tyrosine kinase
MWRYKALVVAAVLLGALVGLGWSSRQPVLYEGTSRVLLSPANPGALQGDNGPQSVDPDRYLRTQTEIVSSMQVMRSASRLAGGTIPPTELRKVVTVAPVKDSDLIEIRAVDSAPERAAQLADSVGVAYQQVVVKQFREAARKASTQLEAVQQALKAQLDDVDAKAKANPDDVGLQADRDAVRKQLATVVARKQTLAVDARVGGAANISLEKATIPEAPVQPQPVRTAAAGALLGLVASSVLAWSLNGRRMARAATGESAVRAGWRTVHPQFSRVVPGRSGNGSGGPRPLPARAADRQYREPHDPEIDDPEIDDPESDLVDGIGPVSEASEPATAPAEELEPELHGPQPWPDAREMSEGSAKRRDRLMVFRRQLPLIIAVTLLVTAAAATYTLRRTPVYDSTASVLVRAMITDTNMAASGQRIGGQLNIFNQRQLAMSEPVAAVAAGSLHTTTTPVELLEHVKVDVPANSQILRIRYRDAVPQTAQRGADAFAKAYLTSREADARTQARARQGSLSQELAQLNNQLEVAQTTADDPSATARDRQAAQARRRSLNDRIQQLNAELNSFLSPNFTPGTVIAAAALPSTPASPDARPVGIGLLVGLFLGVVLAFVRDRTDDRLRGREDLAERLDRPVLATIPPLSKRVRDGRGLRWRRRSSNGLVTIDEPNSPAAESYRTLRTRMARLAAQRDINSVMVVSAGVGEGKSTTAANLAVVLAETGKDVLLVSADLRRPRIHQFFGLPNKSGLSNLLLYGLAFDRGRNPAGDDTATDTAQELWSAVWSVVPSLWVLLSGPPPQHPSALMDSDAMRQFLKEQRDLFDFVILDCPPALVVADAMALAPLADAILVVADAKESDREQVSRLKEEVEQVGGRIVGAVLNRSKQASEATYHRYHNHYYAVDHELQDE